MAERSISARPSSQSRAQQSSRPASRHRLHLRVMALLASAAAAGSLSIVIAGGIIGGGGVGGTGHNFTATGVIAPADNGVINSD